MAPGGWNPEPASSYRSPSDEAPPLPLTWLYPVGTGQTQCVPARAFPSAPAVACSAPSPDTHWVGSVFYLRTQCTCHLERLPWVLNAQSSIRHHKPLFHFPPNRCHWLSCLFTCLFFVTPTRMWTPMKWEPVSLILCHTWAWHVLRFQYVCVAMSCPSWSQSLILSDIEPTHLLSSKCEFPVITT